VPGNCAQHHDLRVFADEAERSDNQSQASTHGMPPKLAEVMIVSQRRRRNRAPTLLVRKLPVDNNRLIVYYLSR